MKPVFDPAALVALRTERGLTVEELAERSGYSTRTLQSLEGGASSGRLRTLRDIAKALGAPLTAIVRSPPKAPAAAPSAPAAQAPRRAATPPAFGREARAALRVVEQSGPPRPELRHDGELLPPLTAGRFELIVSAYKRHAGRKLWVDAQFVDAFGVADDEAVPLGSENGVATRYLAHVTIAEGHVLPVTMHALAPAVVDRLRDVPFGATLRLVVAARVPGALVVSWFGYEQKRPFTLEIVDVVARKPTG